jgi:hypothetical protein
VTILYTFSATATPPQTRLPPAGSLARRNFWIFSIFRDTTFPFRANSILDRAETMFERRQLVHSASHLLPLSTVAQNMLFSRPYSPLWKQSPRAPLPPFPDGRERPLPPSGDGGPPLLPWYDGHGPPLLPFDDGGPPFLPFDDGHTHDLSPEFARPG